MQNIKRQKYGIVILGVFSSYARGEQKETSDVDILVKVKRPLGLKFITAKLELERLLGLKVDLGRCQLLASINWSG